MFAVWGCGPYTHMVAMQLLYCVAHGSRCGCHATSYCAARSSRSNTLSRMPCRSSRPIVVTISHRSSAHAVAIRRSDPPDRATTTTTDQEPDQSQVTTPKSIRLWGTGSRIPPVIVYMDARYERDNDNPAEIGIVIFDRSLPAAQVSSGVTPPPWFQSGSC